MTTTEFAPAKVNLALHITGRRPDGYHDLDSLVIFPNIPDKLEFEESLEISLEICGTFAKELLPQDENLILKAANLLASTQDSQNMGAEIRLQKNLPVAAGIGGGSSNAATTLNVLNRVWNLKLNEPELHGIAISLGSDVSVCLSNSPARIQGKGEIVTRLDKFPRGAIVLVNPKEPLQTANVFENLENRDNPPLPRLNPLPSNLSELVHWLKKTRNDLEKPARKLAPSIDIIINRLNSMNECLFAGVSGSGPTCFGVFESVSIAESASKTMQNNFPHWWVESGKF